MGGDSSVAATVLEDELRQSMDHRMNVLPTNLKALKRLFGVTDKDIATVLGVPRYWVQERITGRTKCDIGALWGFAQAFGVTIDDLALTNVDELRRVALFERGDRPDSLLRSRCSSPGSRPEQQQFDFDMVDSIAAGSMRPVIWLTPPTPIREAHRARRARWLAS